MLSFISNRPNGLMPLAIGFIVTFAVLVILRPLARRWNLLDRPNDDRKRHLHATPLIGGLGMSVGIFVQGLMVWQSDPVAIKSLLLPLLLLVVVGVIDDRWGLGIRIRFLFQIIAALIMTLWGDVAVHNLGDLLGFGPIDLGGYATLFTVICVVGVINGFNMIDGMDGLAGGLAVISLSAILFLGYLHGNGPSILWAGTFLAVLIPFLFFNLRLFGRTQATLFMGDAGSTLLGFALAWFMVRFSQEPQSIMTPVTALWLIAVPLFDLFGSLFRRLIGSQAPFAGDLGHIHHIFQRLGLGINGVCLSLWGLSLFGVIIGLTSYFLNLPQWWLFSAILLLFGIYLLQLVRRQ